MTNVREWSMIYAYRKVVRVGFNSCQDPLEPYKSFIIMYKDAMAQR